ALGCNEPAGTEFPGLVVLGVGRGDGRYLATEGCQELEGKVPEAADADDRGPHPGFDPELRHRREDCRPRAHERAGYCLIESVRKWTGELGINSHRLGPATVAVNDRPTLMCAKRLLAAHTPFAKAARTSVPADPDPCPDFRVLDARPDCGNGTDD